MSLTVIRIVAGLLALGLVTLLLVAYAKIFRKAGYSRCLPLSLLTFVLGILVVPLWFAFAKWPIEVELARLRAAAHPLGSS